MTLFTNCLRASSRRDAAQALAHRNVMSSIACGEDGSLAVVQLATAFTFAVILAFMLNVNGVVHEKLETQDAADAAARAAATWMARGMNALSAANHLVGEATAMIATFEAIAGPNPGRAEALTDVEDNRLTKAYIDLWKAIEEKYPYGFVAIPIAYHEVIPKVRATDAKTSPDGFEGKNVVLAAKIILKTELARIYEDKAKRLRGKSTGRNMVELNQAELDLQVENRHIDALLRKASRVRKSYRLIRTQALPKLHTYIARLVEQVPEAASKTATEIGRLNGVEIMLYPDKPSLPVEMDPLATARDLTPMSRSRYRAGPLPPKQPPPAGVSRVGISRRQIIKITQLCRASFPWVNYHRDPVLQHLRNLARKDELTFTKADKRYFDETVGATIRLCDEYQHRGMGLYVMRRAALPDKGYERWTDDPADADNICSLVAIAKRPYRPLVGALTEEAQPKHVLATAQALVYNANPQEPHANLIDLNTQRITPWHQPKTGWDTLQWEIRKGWRPDDRKTHRSEFDNGMPYELLGKGTLLRPDYPQVHVGWHAKLVGVSASRMADMAAERPDLAGKLMLDPSHYRALLTH